MTTLTAPADLEQLLDAADDLIGAASAASAAVTDLVERVIAADPDGCRAALAALRVLGAAQTRLLIALDQVEG